MEPVRYPIRIYQHASWRLDANFKDPDGNKLDLSDYAGKLQIRRSSCGSEPLLELTSMNGGVVLDNAAADFNVVIRMTNVQTADLPSNNREVDDWVYDFLIYQNTDPEYTTIRLLEGDVYISPAVTREEPSP